jgi:hypothetical protein
MLTRHSTELTDPGGWSHHWRTGGPITLAELSSTGPIPLAGDRGCVHARCTHQV